MLELEKPWRDVAVVREVGDAVAFQFRRRKPTQFKKAVRGIPTLRDHHTFVTREVQANIAAPAAVFLGPFETSTAVDELLVSMSASVIGTHFDINVAEFASAVDVDDFAVGRSLLGLLAGSSGMRFHLSSSTAGIGGSHVFHGSIPLYHRFHAAHAWLGVHVTTDNDVFGWVGCRSQLEP